MLAPMGAAHPGSLGIPAVLIGELPLQHQDLLALRVRVLGEGTARRVAHETGYRSELAAAAVQGRSEADPEAADGVRSDYG